MTALMDWFNTEIRKIKNLNLEVAFHAMIIGLKPEPLSDSLARSEPTILDELRR